MYTYDELAALVYYFKHQTVIHGHFSSELQHRLMARGWIFDTARGSTACTAYGREICSRCYLLYIIWTFSRYLKQKVRNWYATDHPRLNE